MSVMDDMLAWLTTTLDLVEERAFAAARVVPGPWDVEPFTGSSPEAVPAETWVVNGDEGVATARGDLVGEHIALHDPRAVLARVAAERAILAEIASSTAQYPDFDGGHVSGLEDAAMLIAWGHRHDAPGFLPSWAPSDVEVTT